MQKEKLSNQTILVTAGPTYENIDPVRFIGNYSSGKMGFAIASSLASYGVNVILVAGPTALSINHPLVKCINVVSADEMFQQCIQFFPKCNGAILSAAVADYKPKQINETKIKSNAETLTIELVRNPDIAKELGILKTEKQFLVGFALETDNELKNAQEKLVKKNFDFIVLNSLKEEGSGFKHNTNKITIIDKYNNIEKFELKSKIDVAEDIVKKITDFIHY